MQKKHSVHKFSADATPEEFFRMALILYVICTKADITELNRFVISTSKVIDSEDFNKLVRRVSKMLGKKQILNGEIFCSDWLVNSLYELYQGMGITN
jgi:hypothetical protein